MIRNICLHTGLFFILFCIQSCHSNNKEPVEHQVNTIFNHDLSYIPFDSKKDNSAFMICDSTEIRSGRNRVRFSEGRIKLEREINSNFKFLQSESTLNCFLIFRFLVNCYGETGRFRVDAVNFDFSKKEIQDEILVESLNAFKKLDHWNKKDGNADKSEYSKFVNLKIENGKIKHIIL